MWMICSEFLTKTIRICVLGLLRLWKKVQDNIVSLTWSDQEDLVTISFHLSLVCFFTCCGRSIMGAWEKLAWHYTFRWVVCVALIISISPFYNTYHICSGWKRSEALHNPKMVVFLEFWTLKLDSETPTQSSGTQLGLINHNFIGAPAMVDVMNRNSQEHGDLKSSLITYMQQGWTWKKLISKS